MSTTTVSYHGKTYTVTGSVVSLGDYQLREDENGTQGIVLAMAEGRELTPNQDEVRCAQHDFWQEEQEQEPTFEQQLAEDRAEEYRREAAMERWYASNE